MVVRGTKMAGKMGGVWRKLRGLRIWRINNKYNILYINGATIPGPNHCYVRVNDSILPTRRKLITKDNHPPFPTYLSDEAKEQLEEEVFDVKLHKYKDPTLKFEDFQVKKTAKREGAKLAKIK
jgi:large subunit ribosomal protein L3